MIDVDVVRLPAELNPSNLLGRAVVVFDVLRATSTIATALRHGAAEIRVFGSLDEARYAAGSFDGHKLLAGEKHCLRPDGFDLGNSPGDFTPERVAGRTIFLSTTNGTRAILAAAAAERMFCGALLNASATASALDKLALPVTLLCSGTEGQFSVEDFLGAGAVADHLSRTTNASLTNSAAEAAHDFTTVHSQGRLLIEMQSGLSGHNLRLAQLEQDIDFASRVDAMPVVAEVTGVPAIVRRSVW